MGRKENFPYWEYLPFNYLLDVGSHVCQGSYYIFFHQLHYLIKLPVHKKHWSYHILNCSYTSTSSPSSFTRCAYYQSCLENSFTSIIHRGDVSQVDGNDLCCCKVYIICLSTGVFVDSLFSGWGIYSTCFIHFSGILKKALTVLEIVSIKTRIRSSKISYRIKIVL